MKYWTSNPVWITFQEHGSSFYVNIEEKVWLLVKKYGLEKTDRATETSLFDRNSATSLKPRRRSRPLRLVWWALQGEFKPSSSDSADRGCSIIWVKATRFSNHKPESGSYMHHFHNVCSNWWQLAFYRILTGYPLSFETGGTLGYNCCFFLNFVPLHIESPYNFGGKKPSAEGKWACCFKIRAHQTRQSGWLLRLGFNEVTQFLSKSEVLVTLSLVSVFSSPYFFHQ